MFHEIVCEILQNVKNDKCIAGFTVTLTYMFSHVHADTQFNIQFLFVGHDSRLPSVLN